MEAAISAFLNKKAFLAVFVLAAAVAIAWAIFQLGPSSAGKQSAAEAEEIWLVAAVPVAQGPQRPAVELLGTVESTGNARMAAAFDAGVVEVPALEGRTVRRGEVLVRLDARDFETARQSREAEIEQLRATLDSEKLQFETDKESLVHEERLLALARDDLKRQERLSRASASTAIALDQARQQVARQMLAVTARSRAVKGWPLRRRTVEARLGAARAALARVNLDLERTVLKAPFDGRITAVPVSAGSRVRKGDVLVSLYDPARTEIRALIPSRHAATVRAALKEGEPMTAVFSASGDASASGADSGASSVSGGLRTAVLDRIAGHLNKGRGGLDAFFRIEGRLDDLPFGGSIGLRLALPPVEDAFAVPLEAMYGIDRAYKVVDGRMRAVTLEFFGRGFDPAKGAYAVVRSPDLTDGDMLVVTQLPIAVEGLRVNIRAKGS